MRKLKITTRIRPDNNLEAAFCFEPEEQLIVAQKDERAVPYQTQAKTLKTFVNPSRTEHNGKGKTSPRS